MRPVCPKCSAFVRITYRGVRATPEPSYIGYVPVVKGVCWRHGEVEPVGWDWETVFGDWDPEESDTRELSEVKP